MTITQPLRLDQPTRTIVRFLLLALLWAAPALAETPPAPQISSPHPLAGRVWVAATGKFATPSAVIEAGKGSGILLLGETHDNPDHHALQAWVVRELGQSGRRPILALEMVDADQQGALDLSRQNSGEMGIALDWEKRGWPAWGLYRPIVDAALAARGDLKAANLPRDLARQISQGSQSIDVDSRFGLDQPLAAAEQKARAEDIRAGHCNMLPEKSIAPMVKVQRARDAAMAEVLADQSGRPEAGPVVLIAGAGHARADRGVPDRLRAMVPGIRVVSVGFVEVEESKTNPAAYAESFGAAKLPFDLVWFTARAPREDSCARMEQHLKQKESR